MNMDQPVYARGVTMHVGIMVFIGGKHFLARLQNRLCKIRVDSKEACRQEGTAFQKESDYVQAPVTTTTRSSLPKKAALRLARLFESSNLGICMWFVAIHIPLIISLSLGVHGLSILKPLLKTNKTKKTHNNTPRNSQETPPQEVGIPCGLDPFFHLWPLWRLSSRCGSQTAYSGAAHKSLATCRGLSDLWSI